MDKQITEIPREAERGRLDIGLARLRELIQVTNDISNRLESTNDEAIARLFGPSETKAVNPEAGCDDPDNLSDMIDLLSDNVKEISAQAERYDHIIKS